MSTDVNADIKKAVEDAQRLEETEYCKNCKMDCPNAGKLCENKANTNGEKLRRMADEELAVYFWKKRDSFFRMTILEWYNWLKDEADG